MDTGVDYTNPALGGAPFPNAKVVGGTDIADNDNDPMDCEGHGTSVAAIAASGAGVAPDAKVVAIKVFASKDASNNNCADTANDSDIISGVDWAITHRTDFGIVAINLSLGGGFEDSQDHGYCDDDVPDYTEAFDSAVSMGMVVAVASGNDGTANALAAPACVSSAVSVGAVYSQSDSTRSWLDDKGAVQCTDAPTAPDQVVCFSDSATTLSMLAPGAFWIVADKGQGNTLFAGTSASSPAVAGAVALMRQVHPTMAPASIIGILRATGALVTDPRNGVTTPRLDALAAVQFDPSTFFPFLGSAPEIPNGSGSASASVTISGFAGSIAGVEVWVEIDHPDPENLRVTLTGPDGTAVVLHDRTGEHEHPINAIYGKTDVPAQSLGVFGGRQPNGVWTLTVEDQVVTPGAAPGKIRNFAIQLQPGQPTAAIPQNAVGRVLPESAHSQGSKFFLSDISVYNPGNTPRDFSIYYVAAGRTGANASEATKTIAPGQVLALEDLVSSEFGFSDSFGPIFATAKDPNFLIRGRLYTDSVNGSFGHAVPSFATTQGLAMGGGSATANGLIKNDEFHSNVAFTEVSGNPVQVLVEVLDASGAVLGDDDDHGRGEHDTDPRRRHQVARTAAPGQLPRPVHGAVRRGPRHPLRDLRGRHHRRLDLPAGAEPGAVVRGRDPHPVGASLRSAGRLLHDERLRDERRHGAGQSDRLSDPEPADRQPEPSAHVDDRARRDARRSSTCSPPSSASRTPPSPACASIPTTPRGSS